MTDDTQTASALALTEREREALSTALLADEPDPGDVLTHEARGVVDLLAPAVEAILANRLSRVAEDWDAYCEALGHAGSYAEGVEHCRCGAPLPPRRRWFGRKAARSRA